ncbi:MAG: hypothetical protein JWN75_247 [Candidatus Saccharibacteria bacterium]|nr:hypothetical protein [Candidatus Saccharibacteria bacterium]
MENIKLFIATPMYGGMSHGSYTDSLSNLIHVFMLARVPVMYSFRFNEALITKGRNDLVSEFMNSDCSHLMFIDADIGFDANHILSMITFDKDIIAGIYPRKGIEWVQVAQAVRDGVPADELEKYSGSYPVNTLDGKGIAESIISEDQPVEVRSIGTGFMLIKRDVLDGLANKVPEYISPSADAPDGKVSKMYFDTSIDPDTKNLLSEDYHFCSLARNNGYKVWAAPWAVLSHAGTYVFKGRAYKS